MIRTILSGAILFAIIWFAVSNSTAINLNIFLWNISVSASLVIFVTFLVGFVFGVLRVAPSWFRKHMQLGKQKRESEQQIEKLQSEISDNQKQD